MSTRVPCHSCGSVNFDEENGLLVCENGHIQEGGQRIGEDEGDFHAGGRISRKKNEKPKDKVPRIQRGPKGYHLFLKAWQYILWKQCHTLVHHLRLPQDLWTIVKELWILRLTQLQDRIDHPPESANQPGPTEAMFPDLENHEEPKKDKQEPTRIMAGNPSLWDTIALNYCGILILRRPIPLATVYDMIRSEAICFIRAIRQVPRDLRDRLAPEYHNSLDTIAIPQKRDLQNAVTRSAMMYSNAFLMKLPPLNSTPMLVNFIRELSLTLEVFAAAKQIAKTVHFKFSYVLQEERQRTSTSLPEAQLMASIVVATKMLYPFNQEISKISPSTLNEAASLKMDWDKWLEGREGGSSQGGGNRASFGPKDAIEITDLNVLSMSEDRLDQYMDWFQASFIDQPRNIPNLNKEILDMFPMAELSGPDLPVANDDTQAEARIDERLAFNQGQLTSREPVDANYEELEAQLYIRPGNLHQRIRRVANLSPAALTFHREAAQLACLDLDILLRSVWRTERLLLLSQKEQRRHEIFADDIDSDEI